MPFGPGTLPRFRLCMAAITSSIESGAASRPISSAGTVRVQAASRTRQCHWQPVCDLYRLYREDQKSSVFAMMSSLVRSIGSLSAAR